MAGRRARAQVSGRHRLYRTRARARARASSGAAFTAGRGGSLRRSGFKQSNSPKWRAGWVVAGDEALTADEKFAVGGSKLNRIKVIFYGPAIPPPVALVRPERQHTAAPLVAAPMDMLCCSPRSASSLLERSGLFPRTEEEYELRVIVWEARAVATGPPKARTPATADPGLSSTLLDSPASHVLRTRHPDAA